MMNRPDQSGMSCSEFESLLGEALDGQLTEPALARFRTHAESCQVCGPLFSEVEAGRNWLNTLTEVEAPQHLVHNILISTSGLAGTRAAELAQPRVPLWRRIRPRLTLRPAWALVTEPRFGLSLAMAFFSLSLAMSVAGVKISDLQKVDLRPSALDRTYHETESRVVRYYDNIRFVYEVEYRVRELRRTIEPSEPAPQKAPASGQPERKNDSSKQPAQDKQQNYLSEGQRGVILAQQHQTAPDFDQRSMA